MQAGLGAVALTAVGWPVRYAGQWSPSHQQALVLGSPEPLCAQAVDPASVLSPVSLGLGVGGVLWSSLAGSLSGGISGCAESCAPPALALEPWLCGYF